MVGRLVSLLLLPVAIHPDAATLPRPPLPAPVRSMMSRYCADCHDADTKKGGFDLTGILQAGVTEHRDTWEHVVRKLGARQMPPVGKDRPSDPAYDEAVGKLVSLLDRAAAKAASVPAWPPPTAAPGVGRSTRTTWASAWESIRTAVRRAMTAR